MTTPNDPAVPTPPPASAPGSAPGAHDEALAALHQFASGEGPAADEPSDDASPSASGFVGMLAKGPTADPEFAGPAPTTELPPLARPIPHATGDAVSDFRAASNTAEIHEAREVAASPPPAPRTPAPADGRAKSRVRRPPAWYKPAVPIMFTLSSILCIIGIWACGAVLVWFTHPGYYPASAPPNYPLMAYESLRDPETYENVFRVTPLFKTTSLIMLVCLPVAVSMSIMAVIMSRQVSAHDKR